MYFNVEGCALRILNKMNDIKLNIISGPGAASIQTSLFGALCYFTECQLATVEALESRRESRTWSTSLEYLLDSQRHKSIANNMVSVIKQALEQDATLNNDPQLDKEPRLRELLGRELK